YILDLNVQGFPPQLAAVADMANSLRAEHYIQRSSYFLSFSAGAAPPEFVPASEHHQDASQQRGLQPHHVSE
ncbi:hypothetical protein EJ02DRAFT_344607, partial [Clathrospora elynae]